MSEDVVIRPLSAADGARLAAMLRAQPVDYMRFFTPFRFDDATVTTLLAAKDRDVYMGILLGDRLVAFFMLRGWDEGYAVPAYGVAVDHAFASRGLGTVTLGLARVICHQRGADRIMLKVHPDNSVARCLYERTGFVQTGVDPRSGHLVYHLEIRREE